MTFRLTLTQVKQRFKENILKLDNGCWEWQAFRGYKGYGKFKVLGEQLAHRVSFIIYKGPIPKGGLICHTCDNPPCVNPDHLYLGTYTDNNQDRTMRGRNNHHNEGKTHCKRGHEFTFENTYIRKNGSRLCRQCEHDRYVRKKYKGVYYE